MYINRALIFGFLLYAAQSHAATPTPVPAISVTPASLNLGTVALGTATAKIITVKNTGKSALTVSSVGIADTTGEFGQTNDCSTIQPAGTCTVNVTFTPSLPYVAKTGVLTISSNDPRKPAVNVKLSGTAPPPMISATPSALNFGNLPSGTTTSTKSVTIKNSGLSPLDISSVTMTGADPDDFSVSNDCGTVQNGSPCTLNVVFTPAAANARSATMVIASSDPKKPTVTLKLTGSGARSGQSGHTIGGTVSGLSSGSRVTLLDNGGDAKTITANGSFTFPTQVAYGGSYNVTVGAQPTGQVCSIANGTGSGSGVTANVSNVAIVCATDAYTIGGTVSGLASGSQVTLLDNGGDAKTITTNGSFTFPTQVAYGGSYNVTVGMQPTGQVCSIANGTGSGSGVTANVSNVAIVCATDTYTIGGTVSGLSSGSRVTLLDNGGDAKTVIANGSFTFPTQVAYGGSYNVTVGTQPTGQVCSIANGTGSGSDVTTDITNVTIDCTATAAHTLQIWGGAREAIALKSDGTVWSWGYNSDGQIGNGTTANQALPYQIPNLSGITAIMGAELFNLALKSDGTVWGWGANNLRGLNQMYLLGLGSAYDSTDDVVTPMQIPGLSNVTLLGSRGYHAVVAQQDGTVWTWGWNSNLSLGMNNSTVSDTPTQVVGVSNPKMLTAGYRFSVALLQDGTLVSWGSDTSEALGNSAQYGNGALTNSATPVPVTGLTNVIDVSAGWEHVLALKSDGTVWAWGTNSWGGACGSADGHSASTAYGRLGIVDGNGNPVKDEPVPTQVPDLANVIQVSAGDGFSAVLKSDGTVWTFGANGCGQLGNGDNTYAPQYTPVQVKGLSNVIWITARDHHAQAINSDGTVWSWGSGEQGELGVPCTPVSVTQYPVAGNCVNSNVPVQSQMQ